MQIIDELVEYFSDLLTQKQKQEIERLWHPVPDADDDDHDDDSNDDDDSDAYPYEEYDTLYDSPAKKGKSGHAAGKRRPLRHPAVSAEGLVDLFQKEAKKTWQNKSFTLELYLDLAAAHDPDCLTGIRHGRNWRRFILAVQSLTDLALRDVMRSLDMSIGEFSRFSDIYDVRSGFDQRSHVLKVYLFDIAVQYVQSDESCEVDDILGC